MDKTLNLSLDTFQHLKKRRRRGEAMNDLIRRLLGLPALDPSRKPRLRIYYYSEDREPDKNQEKP